MALPNNAQSLLCCPACKSELVEDASFLRCNVCSKTYAIAPWGVCFVEATNSASPDEMRARDDEALYYEQMQLEKKKRDFIDLQRQVLAIDLDAAGKSAPPGPILDAGCGTGLITPPLLTLGRDVVGIDHSSASLRMFQRKGFPEISTHQADVSCLPFRDDTFGIVVSSGVLQHVPAHIRIKALAEACRCLKPGGKIILSTYNDAPFRARGEAATGVFPSGIPYHAYSSTELRNEAASAGFSAIDIRPFGMALFLRSIRGGWRLYQLAHKPLNRLEGFLYARSWSPKSPGLPAEYWVLTAEKPVALQ